MVEPSIERGLGGGFQGVTAGDGEARGKKAPHSLHHGGLPGRRKPPGDDGSLTDGLAEPTAAFGSRLPLLSWTPGAGRLGQSLPGAGAPGATEGQNNATQYVFDAYLQATQNIMNSPVCKRFDGDNSRAKLRQSILVRI